MSDKKFDRRVLFDYLMYKYSITKLPKQIFIKISNIANGKLEGLSKPVPEEHLYDMWVRKSSYLDRIYTRNAATGKKMSSYVRLNYDLAILLAKYDDYLGWLDKQKTADIEAKKLEESVSAESSLQVKRAAKSVDNNKKTSGISDILDELI